MHSPFFAVLDGKEKKIGMVQDFGLEFSGDMECFSLILNLFSVKEMDMKKDSKLVLVGEQK